MNLRKRVLTCRLACTVIAAIRTASFWNTAQESNVCLCVVLWRHEETARTTHTHQILHHMNINCSIMTQTVQFPSLLHQPHNVGYLGNRYIIWSWKEHLNHFFSGSKLKLGEKKKPKAKAWSSLRIKTVQSTSTQLRKQSRTCVRTHTHPLQDKNWWTRQLLQSWHNSAS